MKINVNYIETKAIPLWTFDLPNLRQLVWRWWEL